MGTGPDTPPAANRLGRHGSSEDDIVPVAAECATTHYICDHRQVNIKSGLSPATPIYLVADHSCRKSVARAAIDRISQLFTLLAAHAFGGRGEPHTSRTHDYYSNVDRLRQMRHQPLAKAFDALSMGGPTLRFQQAELSVCAQGGLRRSNEVASLQMVAE